MAWKLLFAGLSTVLAAALWIVAAQGDRRLARMPWRDGEVQVDSSHVPTIYANDWLSAMRLQGYVMASERLWQMELLARRATGRLAAWFGPPAVDHDRQQRHHGLEQLSRAAAQLLPAHERAVCDAFVSGVNAFCDANPWRWGTEYLLLATRPQRWSCADSLSILADITLTLSDARPVHLAAQQWKNLGLDPSWIEFLFSDVHPWNHPVLPSPGARSLKLPPPHVWLPPSPLTSVASQLTPTLLPSSGSNAWTYRSGREAILANDPHLPSTVPGIFFLNRLHVGPDDWVAGASIVGVPGVILGLNPDLAWGFTNTAETAQKLIRENIDWDTHTYEDQPGTWRPLQIATSRIEVRSRPDPVLATVYRTGRGTVWRHAAGDYALQWSGYSPHALRLPVLAFATARNLDELAQAAASLDLPVQNVHGIDRHGKMMFRVSGTAPPLRLGAFHLGLLPAHAHPTATVLPPTRSIIRSDGPQTGALISGNQRIWSDPEFHPWSSDDRVAVIADELGNTAGEVASMLQLQNSTRSLARQQLARFCSPALTDTVRQRVAEWDGSQIQDPQLFAAMGLSEQDLVGAMLHRLAATKMHSPGASPPPYTSRNQRSWLMTLLDDPEAFAIFGVKPQEARHFLAAQVVKHLSHPPPVRRWMAQHPLRHAFRVVGRLFAVSSPALRGDWDTVSAATPDHGAAYRAVYDLSQPQRSRWIMPIGNSGHVARRGYSNLQKLYGEGTSLPIFWKNMLEDPRWVRLHPQNRAASTTGAQLATP